MIRIDALSKQEQEFIYEVRRKFITGKSMDKIAEDIGISRRTAFNWAKKFKELIQEQKVEEFSTIEDKVLSVSNELLGSNKLGDRLKGADLYFKTAEILQKRAVTSTGLQVRDLGELATKPVFRTRIEMSIGIVTSHPKAFAILEAPARAKK